jgi:hypothetical protein
MVNLLSEGQSAVFYEFLIFTLGGSSPLKKPFSERIIGEDGPQSSKL